MWTISEPLRLASGAFARYAVTSRNIHEDHGSFWPEALMNINASMRYVFNGPFNKPDWWRPYK
jgi:hypothetical protein